VVPAVIVVAAAAVVVFLSGLEFIVTVCR